MAEHLLRVHDGQRLSSIQRREQRPSARLEDDRLGGTANCLTTDHFSAFEPGLVAPLLYLRDKTAGFEPKRPEV